MGKMSKKVKEYAPKSKKSCVDAMSVYEAMETAKDVLLDIHIGNPSWGDEWYECTSAGFYKSALRIVERVGKGASLIPAISALNELLDLTELSKQF